VHDRSYCFSKPGARQHQAFVYTDHAVLFLPRMFLLRFKISLTSRNSSQDLHWAEREEGSPCSSATNRYVGCPPSSACREPVSFERFSGVEMASADPFPVDLKIFALVTKRNYLFMSFRSKCRGRRNDRRSGCYSSCSFLKQPK